MSDDMEEGEDELGELLADFEVSEVIVFRLANAKDTTCPSDVQGACDKDMGLVAGDGRRMGTWWGMVRVCLLSSV